MILVWFSLYSTFHVYFISILVMLQTSAWMQHCYPALVQILFIAIDGSIPRQDHICLLSDPQPLI